MPSIRTPLTVMLLLFAGAATACAQNCCLPSLEGDPESAGLLGGIWAATWLLIAVPFALVSTVAARLYYTHHHDGLADRK